MTGGRDPADKMEAQNPAVSTGGVVLLHDNARPNADNSTNPVEGTGPSSLHPDLAPSDSHSFGPLKKHLDGGGAEMDYHNSVTLPQGAQPPTRPPRPASFYAIKSGDNDVADQEPMGCIEIVATVGSIILLILTFPFSIFLSYKVVQEYERAVIFRLGRLRQGGARGPGIFFILPCIDTYCKVDLRTVSFDVPPQEVLSRDSVTVNVDAVVFYRVNSPTMATNNVEDYSHSTRLLAATTLRNVLGTRNLSEILSEREAIAHTMQSALDEATDPWGVKVERVEIKDVRLPIQLQRAMAAEAEAAREARAKVIAAEGEMKASRALKEASDIISESPAALQLRYLQTLNTISAEKNSTIIFPLPMDIVTPFLGIKK